MVEKWLPRHNDGEDRVPGLNNLREILDLSLVVAKKGKIHKGLGEGDLDAVFIGAYRGNKYEVKYRLFGGGDFEESEITGQDIGITISYGQLVLPPFRVGVDYYYGKRNVKEILRELKPVTESAPEEQAIEVQPTTSRDNAPIGILAILGGAHYIFARTLEEAGGMYAAWCEDQEAFDLMRRALADSKSLIPPFCVRPLDRFPNYMKAAEERIAQQSREERAKNVSIDRITLLFELDQFLNKT